MELQALSLLNIQHTQLWRLQLSSVWTSPSPFSCLFLLASHRAWDYQTHIMLHTLNKLHYSLIKDNLMLLNTRMLQEMN